jgi:hypothetical protein
MVRLAEYDLFVREAFAKAATNVPWDRERYSCGD